MGEEMRIGAVGPKMAVEAARAVGASGAEFREILDKSIGQLSRLQAGADAAVARLAAGRTDGIREVYGAAQRAELIMQIRNKLEQACDEIRQMRF